MADVSDLDDFKHWYLEVRERIRVMSWSGFTKAIEAGATEGRVAGYVLSKTERRTKTGNRMALITFSDSFHEFEVIVFNTELEKFRELFTPQRKLVFTLHADIDKQGLVRGRLTNVVSTDEIFEAMEAMPQALVGVISPVDFTVSKSGLIRAQPSIDAKPALQTKSNKADHANRLNLCKDTAVDILERLHQRRFNVRDAYKQALSDYIRHLPTDQKSRNILFADQEARFIRDLFEVDKDELPPDFSARLRVFLQAHQSVREFYPGLIRFYDAVRFGKNDDPLPIDAISSIARIVEQNPSVFENNVGQAITDAGVNETLPKSGGSKEHSPPTSVLSPPPDPMGNLPSRKATAYTKAGIINRLWTIFQKGEVVHKNADAWTKATSQLLPHVKKVIGWLLSFLSSPN